MQKQLAKTEYALRFICDRLNRTLRYAESKDGTNRPDITIPLKDALTATVRAWAKTNRRRIAAANTDGESA